MQERPVTPNVRYSHITPDWVRARPGRAHWCLTLSRRCQHPTLAQRLVRLTPDTIHDLSTASGLCLRLERRCLKLCWVFVGVWSVSESRLGRYTPAWLTGHKTGISDVVCSCLHYSSRDNLNSFESPPRTELAELGVNHFLHRYLFSVMMKCIESGDGKYHSTSVNRINNVLFLASCFIVWGTGELHLCILHAQHILYKCTLAGPFSVIASK